MNMLLEKKKKQIQSIKSIINEIGNELQTNKHQHRSLYSIFLNWNYVVEVAHWYTLSKRICYIYV